MPQSAACRSSTHRRSVARCRSKDYISAASPIRTMSNSCSRKPRLNSVYLPYRSDVRTQAAPLLLSTMLGNRAFHEVGKSYNRGFGIGKHDLHFSLLARDGRGLFIKVNGMLCAQRPVQYLELNLINAI